MKKSKSELMRETRQRRRNAGLVEFRVWVTPAEKTALAEVLDRLIDQRVASLPINQ